MVHVRASLIALVFVLLHPLTAEAGSVLIMEAPAGMPGSAVHREFFSELGLVLEHDELFRRSDDNGVFFSASVEEKIEAAGMFCDSGASMSVIWIDADDKSIHRLGMVVDTPSGKVARVVTFDKSPPVSEVALVAGELLAHGRRFAETSVAKADGWIVVQNSEQIEGPDVPRKHGHARGVTDPERPWEDSGVSVQVPIGEREPLFSFGIAFEFVQSISNHVGPGMWMGQTLHGTLRPSQYLSLSLTFSTFGSVFPTKDDVTVRGVQLVPRCRIGFFWERSGMAMLVAVSGGAASSKLRISNDDNLRNREISFWDGVIVGEVLMMFLSDGPVSVHVGPVITGRFPERVYELLTDEGSEEKQVIYHTSLVYLGAKLGVTVFL